MRRITLSLLLALAATGTAAEAVKTDLKPVTVVVSTPDRAFAPHVIRIPAGRPVRLVVRNPSGNDHDLHAPVFFAKAKIDEADANKLWDGEVQVPKGSAVSVRLIAAPGHYQITSTKPLDVAGDMKAEILAY